jgi:hypothetical protein
MYTIASALLSSPTPPLLLSPGESPLGVKRILEENFSVAQVSYNHQHMSVCVCVCMYANVFRSLFPSVSRPVRLGCAFSFSFCTRMCICLCLRARLCARMRLRNSRHYSGGEYRIIFLVFIITDYYNNHYTGAGYRIGGR